jgi:serine/threonine-protein kinase
MIGETLSNFRITAKLGEGGMGEVYRAQDTKLGREVAIKVLPPALAGDPERMTRFEREARILAALDHPGIASIYGLEEADGRQILVMQLVEGDTLDERMTRGALSLTETLSIAVPIAEALEAAHERGIIHRDLKPANIKVGSDGKVTLLDFGLARALESGPQGNAQDPMQSPTLTSAGTAVGMILGTAAYMSPEQAAAQPVDRRCDIWSFGVVVFEMLSGRRLFQGETVSHTLADVLRADLDWSLLPDDLPRAVRRLLERCLDRDPKRRLRDIGEARVVLGDVRDHPARFAAETEAPTAAVGIPAAASRPGPARFVPWAVAAVATVLAVMGFLPRLFEKEAPPPSPRRFTIKSPHGGNFRVGDDNAIAISPDGMLLVSRGFSGNEDLLYLRPLGESEARPVTGTNNSTQPFFSPDGKWLGFISTRGLWKVNLLGGAPVKIGDFKTLAAGATWSDDGNVYYSTSGAILRVPASGGDAETIAEPDEAAGERALRQPSALPGSRGLVFDARKGDRGTHELQVLDLSNGDRKSLGLQGSSPLYVKTGHLLYQQQEAVFAVPFDVDALELRGEPVPVPEKIRTELYTMHVAVSDEGTLAYLPARDDVPKLVLVDRQGVSRPLVTTELPFKGISDPRFSPDGKRLVLTANGIWIVDLETGIPTLVSEDGFYPVWSPDGESLVFGVTQSQSFDLYRRPADLSQPQKLLLDWDDNLRSAAWAPDGTLIFRQEIQGKGMDLKLLSISDFDDPDDATRPLLEGPADEIAPAISPDGRWVAYVSAQSGRDEVYVTSFPHPAGVVQVSLSGGGSPSWAPDGDELFYIEGDRMIAVGVATEPSFRVLDREVLFSGEYSQYRWQRQYDVAPDGERFVMIESPPGGADVEVVLDWFTELRELAPASN